MVRGIAGQILAPSDTLAPDQEARLHMPTRARPTHPRTAAVLVVLLLAALLLYGFSGDRRDLIGTTTTWMWKARYGLAPVRDRAALVEIHRNAERRPRSQCIACHDDKTSSKLVLHRIHLRDPLLTNLECRDCHQHIDLSNRGNAAVVTWVDVGFCRGCHSAFPGASGEEPASCPADLSSNCVTCHVGEKAPKHAKHYLPRDIPASACRGCHGGRVLPSSARHEAADWLQVHGQEALASGADGCYQCHDFGLKFCDQCHAKKPPTHLPADAWRASHPTAARTDTRVCYSCHELSYCKSCHLNHEAGWVERHASFVREKGTSSCTECHSQSACSFCHMRDIGSGDLTEP